MSRRYLGSFVTYNPVQPTTSAASGMWPLDQQLQQVAAGTWPLPFGDPYFNYTSLLLSTTSLSNANNNLFVDSSGAFNPISRSGNTTQGSFAPYGTYWSNFFDGSGDYLTLPASSALAFGTGDFTIEFWMQSTVFSRDPYDRRIFRCLADPMAGTGNGWEIVLNGNPSGGVGQLYFSTPSAGTIVSTTTTVCDGSWKHIAITRQGNTFRLFVNGALIATNTATPTISDPSTYNTYISWFGGTGAAYFNGYLSNVRFNKGTALYTAAFTPPAYPLTAVSGTSLLTCQSNRFRDASTNNFTITVTGNTSVTNFAPFLHTAPIQYNQSDITNWSGYFDGSGDYLDVPNNTGFDQNTAFTVEMWVYPTGADITDLYFYSQNTTNYFCLALNSSGQIAIDKSGVAFVVTSSAAITVGAWTHIAMVSNGSTISLYVNGVSQGSAAVGTTAVSTSTVRIGAWQGTGGLAFPGYISNLRVVKGTAVYTSNFTPPTTNLTAISGTSLLTLQNAAFTDNSTNNFVITQFGNTTVTGNSPFNTVGYWSNYFDGTGDNLSISNFSSSALSFGTGDFTIEFWVNPTTLPNNNWSPFFTMGNGSGGGQEIRLSQNINGTGWGWLYPNNTNNADVFVGYGTLPINTWHHIAMTRSGSTMRLFLNGAVVATGTGVSFNFTNTTLLRIAMPQTQYADGTYNGFISNVRVVKGTALYTAAFTPSTTPLTAVSGTGLLTCQASRFIDSSGNAFTLTVNGNPSVQSFDPFYTATIASNGGSMYFDGSADYIEPSWSSASLPGSWTFECWFYATAASGMIFDCRPNATNGYYPNVSIANSTQIDFYYNTNSNLITVPGGTINKWIHLAVVKNGTSLVVYLDGVSSFSTTDSNTWAIGASRPRIGANGGYYSAAPAPLTGYISNFRILNGTAAYTAAFTPPTAPASPTPNTNLLLNGMNAGAYDATAINNMETVGNAQVSTAVSKFGGSSMYFDGTGDYLTPRSTPDLDFGSGDFTVEFWAYPNSKTNVVDAAFGYGSFTLMCYHNNTNWTVEGSNNGSSLQFQISTPVTLNTWQLISITRSGTTIRLFKDGVIGATGSLTGAINTSGKTLRVGDNGNSQNFTGYLDDFRITKGYARYTANFTPPTAALPTY